MYNGMPLPPGIGMRSDGLPYDMRTGRVAKRFFHQKEDAAKASRKSKPAASKVDEVLESAPEVPKPAVKKGKTDADLEAEFNDPSKLTSGMKTGGAIRRALDKARAYANGGRVVVGPLVGETDGRADKLEASVPPGSHVIPADCVGYLGQGNSNAGLKALQQRFRHSAVPRRAAGGEIPVLLSDGEFVVSPEDVAEMGGGDPEKGHKALDALILSIRKNHIDTLKKLPGPVKG